MLNDSRPWLTGNSGLPAAEALVVDAFRLFSSRNFAPTQVAVTLARAVGKQEVAAKARSPLPLFSFVIRYPLTAYWVASS